MAIRAFLILALVLAACSGSGADTTTTTTTNALPTTAAGDTTSTTDAPEPTTPAATTVTSAPTPPTTRAVPRTTQPPVPTTRATTGTSAPTTTRRQPPSRPPSVTITTPGSVERYRASYDAAAGNFGATVSLAASATDPEGDSVIIEWYSDLHGFLGTGTSLAARLAVFGDASQPVITAVAIDSTGARSQASRQVIVWIPSDT